MVAGELTEDDIRAARAIRIDHPSWVGAVAGGNPKALEAVAEVALADFIVMTMMEIDGELD